MNVSHINQAKSLPKLLFLFCFVSTPASLMSHIAVKVWTGSTSIESLLKMDNGLLPFQHHFLKLYNGWHSVGILKNIGLLLHRNTSVYVEMEDFSFWQNFHPWSHWKLSKWQLPVQPVMKIFFKMIAFLYQYICLGHIGLRKESNFTFQQNLRLFFCISYKSYPNHLMNCR